MAKPTEDACNGPCAIVVGLWAAGVALVASGLGFGVWHRRTQHRRGAESMLLRKPGARAWLAWNAVYGSKRWWRESIPLIVDWMDSWLYLNGHIPHRGLWLARCSDARFEIYDAGAIPDPKKNNSPNSSVSGLYLGYMSGKYRPFQIRCIASSMTITHELMHAFEHLHENVGNTDWAELNAKGQHFKDPERFKDFRTDARRADADGLFTPVGLPT